jgi:integrase
VSSSLRGGDVDATAHQLRHTNATQVYLETRDPLLLQGHLGHRTLATVQVYARAAGLASDLVEGLFGGGAPPALTDTGAAGLDDLPAA